MSAIDPYTEVRLVHIASYVTRMIAQLPFQFQYKPRWRALVTALGTGAQLLEDITFSLLTDTTLNAATGDALEQWGDTVLEPKVDLPDSDYLPIILGRLPATKNGGSPDEWITLYETLTASPVKYSELFPASIQLVAFPEKPFRNDYARRIHRTMVRAKVVGIGMELVESPPGGFLLDTESQGLDSGLLGRVLPPSG